MRGHKHYRAGAWRLVIAAGTDPLTGRRKTIHETVHAPDNRAGAKAADARLAELIVAVESDMVPDPHQASQHKGPTVTELATAWQTIASGGRCVKAHSVVPCSGNGAGRWLPTRGPLRPSEERVLAPTSHSQPRRRSEVAPKVQETSRVYGRHDRVSLP